jgi:hypothetical protein
VENSFSEGVLSKKCSKRPVKFGDAKVMDVGFSAQLLLVADKRQT